MKAEQLDRIVKKLANNGFGYIAAAELRKLAVLVMEEAILDAVFEPLEQKPDE